jgi:hypothetical protein
LKAFRAERDRFRAEVQQAKTEADEYMRQLFIHRLDFREEAEAALREFVQTVHDI